MKISNFKFPKTLPCMEYDASVRKGFVNNIYGVDNIINGNKIRIFSVNKGNKFSKTSLILEEMFQNTKKI
ncbi:hypothetical protein ACFL20_06390 [Spirochaetota bacterium]